MGKEERAKKKTQERRAQEMVLEAYEDILAGGRTYSSEEVETLLVDLSKRSSGIS